MSEELRREFEMYLKLRPYFGHCLSLNHEINNTLAGILGYAEFLNAESGNLDADQQDCVKQILVCAERLRATVESLCHEKIALEEELDLRSIIDAYRAAAKC